MGLFEMFDPHYKDNVKANMATLKAAFEHPIKASDAEILEIRALIEKANDGKFPEKAQHLLNILKNPKEVYERAHSGFEATNNGWQQAISRLGFGHVNESAQALSDIVAMQLAVKALREKEEPKTVGDKPTTNRVADITSAVYIVEHPKYGIFKNLVRENFSELHGEITKAHAEINKPAPAPATIAAAPAAEVHKDAPTPAHLIEGDVEELDATKKKKEEQGHQAGAHPVPAGAPAKKKQAHLQALADYLDGVEALGEDGAAIYEFATDEVQALTDKIKEKAAKAKKVESAPPAGHDHDVKKAKPAPAHHFGEVLDELSAQVYSLDEADAAEIYSLVEELQKKAEAKVAGAKAKAGTKVPEGHGSEKPKDKPAHHFWESIKQELAALTERVNQFLAGSSEAEGQAAAANLQADSVTK